MNKKFQYSFEEILDTTGAIICLVGMLTIVIFVGKVCYNIWKLS